MENRIHFMAKHKNIPPRCLAIHDLSSVGRCALSVALPVLGACGIQTIALPTAIFSNHLGFKDCMIVDFSEHMIPFMDTWEISGIGFDLIYSGFLATKEQIEIVQEAIRRYADERTEIIVDPAMADEGKLYRVYDDEMVNAMRRLLEYATLTTPNYTEACMLAEYTYSADVPSAERLATLAKALTEKGPHTAVITSIPAEEGKEGIYVYNKDKREQVLLTHEVIPLRAVGTGDLFASALIGALYGGLSVEEAAREAGRFVTSAVRKLWERKLDPRYGVPFEEDLSEWALGVKR